MPMVAETSVEKMFNFGQGSGCKFSYAILPGSGSSISVVSREILAPG